MVVLNTASRTPPRVVRLEITTIYASISLLHLLHFCLLWNFSILLFYYCSHYHNRLTIPFKGVYTYQMEQGTTMVEDVSMLLTKF